jgi:excisionase family DNA binding protein
MSREQKDKLENDGKSFAARKKKLRETTTPTTAVSVSTSAERQDQHTDDAADLPQAERSKVVPRSLAASAPHHRRGDRGSADDAAAGARLSELTPVTVKEAAGLLGRNVKTVYEAIARGEIPSIRLGRLVLIPRPAFERLLRSGSEAA